MSNTLTISKLADLTITIASDGGVTLSYPGQTTITQAPGTCYKWYTYGTCGSKTTPLVFVSTSCTTPTGLTTTSYVNDTNFSIALGTVVGKYYIAGNGDIRPAGTSAAISINVDNQSAGSTGPFPDYLVICTSGSGPGATVTLYHP